MGEEWEKAWGKGMGEEWGRGTGEGWGRIKHDAYVLSCIMYEYLGDKKNELQIIPPLYSHKILAR